MEKNSNHSTSYRQVNFSSDIHYIPNDDWFKHDYDVNCPCLPYLDTKDTFEETKGKQIFVHRQIKGNKDQLV